MMSNYSPYLKHHITLSSEELRTGPCWDWGLKPIKKINELPLFVSLKHESFPNELHQCKGSMASISVISPKVIVFLSKIINLIFSSNLFAVISNNCRKHSHVFDEMSVMRRLYNGFLDNLKIQKFHESWSWSYTSRSTASLKS